MKFTVTIEIDKSESADDVAKRLERVADAIRKQSEELTFAADSGLSSAYSVSGAISFDNGDIGEWELKS